MESSALQICTQLIDGCIVHRSYQHMEAPRGIFGFRCNGLETLLMERVGYDFGRLRGSGREL